MLYVIRIRIFVVEYVCVYILFEMKIYVIIYVSFMWYIIYVKNK